MAKIKRDFLDKFYTKDNIVNICLNELNLSKFRTIVEPSAGSGSFSKKINNCIAFDIEPENENIIKKDFLYIDLFFWFEMKRPILVVGNPPFGRQSSMVIKFIKKSCGFADTIAFILPKSFKKQSMMNKIPLNYHLMKSIDLPENCFLLNGRDYDVPCVFQVWERSNIIREIDKKLSPKSFTFVKKGDNPDFSFRRVGVYAGRISSVINDKSDQSHYFLKANNPSDLLEKIEKIKWDHNNTTGPRSISKQELIKIVDYKDF